jgi:hypothetical protein
VACPEQMGDSMLPLRNPMLNGIELSHAELRALHQNRRIAIHQATARYCLDGPRLLHPPNGERCTMTAHRRDADGLLLASVTVTLPEHGARFIRRIRLVRWEDSDVHLKVEVARELRQAHT